MGLAVVNRHLVYITVCSSHFSNIFLNITIVVAAAAVAAVAAAGVVVVVVVVIIII